MRCLRLLPALVLTSCLQIGTGDDGDAGVAAASATASTADAQPTPTGGTGCATDSASGTMLCTSIDQCPGIAIDHDAYPDCGFRVPSTTIDLECFCDNFLCPVGAVISCAQVTALLADQSEVITCVQQNEGRCAPRAAPKPSGSSCDTNCSDACAGDINCRTLCGC